MERLRINERKPFLSDEVEEKLEEGMMNKPTNIWNCYESGYQCNADNSKIICKRGEKNIIKPTSNGDKNYYTVMTCCNAEGV